MFIIVSLEVVVILSVYFSLHGLLKMCDYESAQFPIGQAIHLIKLPPSLCSPLSEIIFINKADLCSE
jgi:hypothetical protein